MAGDNSFERRLSQEITFDDLIAERARTIDWAEQAARRLKDMPSIPNYGEVLRSRKYLSLDDVSSQFAERARILGIDARLVAFGWEIASGDIGGSYDSYESTSTSPTHWYGLHLATDGRLFQFTNEVSTVFKPNPLDEEIPEGADMYGYTRSGNNVRSLSLAQNLALERSVQDLLVKFITERI